MIQVIDAPPTTDVAEFQKFCEDPRLADLIDRSMARMEREGHWFMPTYRNSKHLARAVSNHYSKASEVLERLNGLIPQRWGLLCDFSATTPFLLPLSYIHTSDRGDIVTYLDDLTYPLAQKYLWSSGMLSTDMRVPFSDGKTLEYTPNGRTDLDMELTATFEIFLKNHGQVSRGWRKAPSQFKLIERPLGQKPTTVDWQIREQNIEYHITRDYDLTQTTVTMQDTPGLFHLEGRSATSDKVYSFFFEDSAQFEEPNQFSSTLRAFDHWIGDQKIGVSHIQIDEHGKSIWWIMTERLRHRDSLPSGFESLPWGNLTLLQLIQWVYQKGYAERGFRFNLGVDIFPYKKVWKPNSVACPGFNISSEFESRYTL